jgi:two-component system, OmpR family, copper resistance phosphate regulon response regulator CusR
VRILLVEDDERIVQFMKRGLEAEEYQVEVAPDGQKGIDLVKSSAYDVIILDIYLPLKNGLEVCKTVREQRLTIPILMMTAKDSPELQRQGYLAGANDYLPKPFSFEVLLSKIEKWSPESTSLPPRTNPSNMK